MKKLRKYGSLTIALYPLLAIYATLIPGISIGEFTLIILSGIYLFKFRKKIPFYFKGFTIYTLLISALMCLLHYEYPFATFAFHAVSTFLIVYLISTACAIGDINYVTNQLKKVSAICLIFFIIQYALYVVTSSTVSGIIPFLPLSNGENSAEFHDLQMGRDRMSSFFEEPAHFSEFLCIPLCLFLFGAKKRKDFVICVFITISIFLSTSALGAISVVIIWGMWFLNYLRGAQHKWLSYMVTFVMIVALPTLAATEFVTATTSRLTEITGEGVEGSVHGFSSYVRVLRGYIPFQEQDFIIKVVGNGIGSLESYIKYHHSQYLSLFAGLPDYINSVQYILLGSGIIGLYLFLKQLYEIFNRTSAKGKTLILTMFAQMFASGIHSSSVFLIAVFIAVKECNFCKDINHGFNNSSNIQC